MTLSQVTTILIKPNSYSNTSLSPNMYQGAPSPILSYNSLALSGHKRQIIFREEELLTIQSRF